MAEEAYLTQTTPDRSDTARVNRTLDKLRGCGLRDFDLTGSLAFETHRLAREARAARRTLNDIDIVVADFATVPQRLTADFLVMHVHPDAHAGKMVVQIVDPEESLRIDIFSAYGRTRQRSSRVVSPFGEVPVVSIEDLAARAGSIVFGLARGERVARKHADDFGVLAAWSDPDLVEICWQDHRRSNDPSTFKEASRRIRELVLKNDALLVAPQYSQDPDAVCPKCRELGRWRRAPGRTILSILGYV